MSKEKVIPALNRIAKHPPSLTFIVFFIPRLLFRARPVSDSDMTPSVTEVAGGGGGGEVLLVMGGREVGQVNMFQRNISLWKLAL